MTVATLNNINDSELFQTSTQDKLFSRIRFLEKVFFLRRRGRWFGKPLIGDE
jgi:hypothetical protein